MSALSIDASVSCDMFEAIAMRDALERRFTAAPQPEVTTVSTGTWFEYMTFVLMGPRMS
jgi:hypothetical protein